MIPEHAGSLDELTRRFDVTIVRQIVNAPDSIRGGMALAAIDIRNRWFAAVEMPAGESSHATIPVEQLERLLCRVVGHRPFNETAAEPVCDFWICLRCGRFWR